MTKILIQSFLHGIILVPFAIFFLKEKSKLNFQRIFVFLFCYVVYQIVLSLPRINSTFDIIKGNWNWDGKAYGVILGIIFYFLFRKLFRENDFFTLRQFRENFNVALIWATIMVLLSFFWNFIDND